MPEAIRLPARALLACAMLLLLGQTSLLRAQEPALPPALVDRSLTGEPLPLPAPPPTEDATAAITPTPTAESIRQDLLSLSALLDSLQARERRQETLHERLRAAGDDVQRAAIRAELERTIGEARALRARFQAIALATDTGAFQDEAQGSGFDLRAELEQLAQPLLAELRAVTAESRELEQINRQLAQQIRRREAAQRAIEHLDLLIAHAPEVSALAARLGELRRAWRERLQDAENQVTALDYQRKHRLAERESVLERTRGFAANFVGNRGRNLLLGVAAFLLVYFGMRGLFDWLRVRPPIAGLFGDERPFAARLFALGWTVFGMVAATGAMLSVFNMVGDWFLLSLALIFLIGLGWAGMQALPKFVEQFRMMLNIGAVKEKQRLLFDGIPWRVESIGFATRLVNPLLDGGVMVLPTYLLVGLHSRPNGHQEPWFPSRAGDWVLLADGTHAKTIAQTPSAVCLEWLGGARQTLPTGRYVELAPLVLSHGYRRAVRFRLGHELRGAAVGAVRERLRDWLRATLGERLGGKLRAVTVELEAMGESALEFVAWLDCGSGAGEHWSLLPCWAQAALLELCNREGWTIPQQHVRIGRAGEMTSLAAQ